MNMETQCTIIKNTYCLINRIKRMFNLLRIHTGCYECVLGGNKFNSELGLSFKFRKYESMLLM